MTLVQTRECRRLTFEIFSRQKRLPFMLRSKSAASSVTKPSDMGRDSLRQLMSLILFCSVELIQLSKGNAELVPREEIALENWRQSFDLPTWADDPCSSVDWIVCDNTSQPAHLITIDLNRDSRNRTLNGTIPNTVAFTNISRLVLSKNNLTGGIPASLFNHSSMKILYLNSNPFGGSIPDLSGMTSLKQLALDNIQVNGSIPESITYLTKATIIRLSNNPQLRGFIPDISALTSLEYLDASSCSLSGPLPDLRDAKKLTSVQLQGNDFRGSIPPALFQHEKLQWLDLENNFRLSGQVPDVKGLVSVKKFFLHNCNLSGPLPPFTANLMLRYIGLENNRFTTFPSDLQSLTNLSLVRVSNNTIEGALPDLPPSYAQTSPEFYLKYLIFSNNRFSGGIPRSWNELKYVEEMALEHNNLSGVIPKEIGSITSLKTLTLSNNRFSGSIPEELGRLSNLEKLDLENNQFSGIVPETLASLPNLHTLLLKNNGFTGIPASLLQKRPGLNITYDTNITILYGQSTSDSDSDLPVGAIIGVVIGALGATVAVLTITLCMIKKKTNDEDQLSKDDLPKSAQAYTLKQIKAITGNYKTLIGKGGFGPVYYGKLTDGKEVAVKVRATDSKQGSGEFLNEVRLLSRLHHRNIVSLVGYCLEAQQQILVYAYMSQGSFHDHLQYHADSSSKAGDFAVHQPLSWKKRLDIAMNAARGIEYLHKDCNPPVIHRDVKTSNILLTDKLEAKVADLGLSKQVPEPDTDEALNMSGVSTAVKGTLGYIDPEYFVRRKLTTKSDVFSFGVVLLEMITGKRPQSQEFTDSAETNLIDWARVACNMNKLEFIVDPALIGEYHKDGLMKVARVALSCVLPYSAERPEMGDIVSALTEALQTEGVGTDESFHSLVNLQPKAVFQGSVSHSCRLPTITLEHGPQIDRGYFASGST